MPPPSFSNTQAMFLGFGLEGVCYGIHAVLFILAMRYLLRRKQKSNTPFMIFFACLLFACCTAHFALEFDHMYRVLILNPVPTEEVAAETNELVGADMLFSITDFFAQLVLIYRLWVVWQSNYWLIILPCLLAVAGISCAMTGLGMLLHIDPTAAQAPAAIQPLGDAAFALPLCFNFIVTLLIASRIWWQGRTLRLLVADVPARPSSHSTFTMSSSHIRSAIGVIIESGALYLIAQFVFVVLFAIGHPAQNLVVPITAQIYGIAPTLIFVRVGMGLSSETTIPTLSTYQSSSYRTHAPITISTTRRMSYDYELPSLRSKVEFGKDTIIHEV